MWKGRFKKQASNRLQQFGESISYDWRLFHHDIAGSIAHAAALKRAGILTPEEEVQIREGLKAIEKDIAEGHFEFQVSLEDIHMHIESELTRRIGPAGAKLHTARSRNDQIALDIRLYLREEISFIQKEIAELQGALVAWARRSKEIVLPGYTHLQRAQPVPAAHHLLAYVEMYERDKHRLTDVSMRLDELPLGAGAIAGSTIVLDRAYIAERLGFSRVTQNSMDAVADRDFGCEFLAALAILGMHLSRLSEDVILWNSEEFGFLELSDAHTTGSSLMPQKKNPDIAELTRGKTGRLYGNLVSLLTTMKGLPLTYNRDMQEDKEALFDSIDTVRAILPLFAEMLDAAEFRKDRTDRAASDPLLLATDLADYVVKKGVPFREAHGVVGRLVACALEKGVSLDQLPLKEMRVISPVFEEDVYAVFDLQQAIRARKAIGATAPEIIAERLAFWEKKLKKE